MAKYRKKPVEVEAVRWTGNHINGIRTFTEGNAIFEWFGNQCVLGIGTLEGMMRANTGDYIIKGVNGEFYPCKPDIFEKTYERVKEDG